MPITKVETSLDAVYKQFGRPEVHIGALESESPWVPFVNNVFIRHLAFDVRQSAFANILWVKSGGVLGKHRHRGQVFAITLEGSWRYLEYDWVARPGDYVQENPGVIHTLVSDDPQGMKTFFWLNGSLEFYDDDNNLTQILDVFWMMDHYLSYCREKGLPVNQKLFI